MMYDGYIYGGMNLVWWFIWMVIMFWIFATPYNIPGQRMSKVSALDILQKRFASGAITKDEFLEMKKVLGIDLAKQSG